MPKTPKTPPAKAPRSQAPPSQKNAQVSQLLQSMQVSASAKAPVSRDLLHRELDLRHYKTEHAYPGAKYYLIGNSYNVQFKNTAAAAKKRAAAVSALFNETSGQHSWQKLSSALKHGAFYDSLSRFEQQWLSHEPAGSVIGPAYDQSGKPLSGVFAVWRLEAVHQQRAESYNYSNPKAQYSQPQQQSQQKTNKKLAAAR